MKKVSFFRFRFLIFFVLLLLLFAGYRKKAIIVFVCSINKYGFLLWLCFSSTYCSILRTNVNCREASIKKVSFLCQKRQNWCSHIQIMACTFCNLILCFSRIREYKLWKLINPQFMHFSHSAQTFPEKYILLFAIRLQVSEWKWFRKPKNTLSNTEKE